MNHERPLGRRALRLLELCFLSGQRKGISYILRSSPSIPAHAHLPLNLIFQRKQLLLQLCSPPLNARQIIQLPLLLYTGTLLLFVIFAHSFTIAVARSCWSDLDLLRGEELLETSGELRYLRV